MTLRSAWDHRKILSPKKERKGIRRRKEEEEEEEEEEEKKYKNKNKKFSTEAIEKH
jgi:hypothetical protein